MGATTLPQPHRDPSRVDHVAAMTHAYPARLAEYARARWRELQAGSGEAPEPLNNATPPEVEPAGVAPALDRPPEVL